VEIQNVGDIIIEVMNDYFDGEGIETKANMETRLFGGDSVLDSIGLVTIIIDIEMRLSELGIDITLTSEKAMSQKNSPFKSVSTLADFVHEQRVNNDE
jgi:acyl carrier protein